MNYKSFRYILLFLAVVTATDVMMAQEADSVAGVMRRVERNAKETERLLTQAWNNPAIMQLWRDYSISEVKVGYTSRNENNVIDIQRGDKDNTLLFDARTYMKHRNSTLWGEAYYHNGRIKGINWNETSEPQVVQPYLLADSVGGTMNVERYSFMGGWARYDGKLAVGASMGYTAGLYYRNVDPRPRNVTANLDVQAGIGYNVWRDYVLAASLNYKKYKQTNNVAFYSELGNDKIFHLLGFANDYSRFAGTGIQTYYNGNRIGATLNFHPATGKGISASVEASRFTFNNVITQLNKLPLAHVGYNVIDAEMAWMSQDWGVRAFVEASRRVGTENIFGDPAGSVYTCIGKLDMSFQNTFCASVDGVWQRAVAKSFTLALHPAIAYNHYNEIYVDPASSKQVNEMNYSVLAKGSAMIGRRTHLALSVAVNHISPTSSDLMMSEGDVKPELAGLQRAVATNFQYLSGKRTTMLAALDVTVAINNKYALRGSAKWKHTHFVFSTHRDELDFSLGIVF